MKRFWVIVVGCYAVSLSAIEVRPNILWIIPEDLSPFFGCYGDSVNQGHTPAVDTLADEGVLFKRAYVTAPVCSSCRSALITGVMQTTIGAHHHRSSRTTDGEIVSESARIYLPEGMKTVPELMREAGYFTFNNGKDDYNFHYNRRALYTVGNPDDYAFGMNGWQGNHAKHKDSFTQDTWNARPDKSQPWFGQIQLKGGKAGNRYTPSGEVLPDDAVELPPYFPNTPAHQKAWTSHYNAVRGTDAQVEAILSLLEKDGELEHTIIFFFSDHGSNTSLRHKQFCYEGGLHVPFVVRGDHPSIPKGSVRNELVNILDISATTLRLGEAQMPEYLDGENLFSNDYDGHPYVVSARDRCDYTIDRIRTVRSDKYRYIRNFFPDRSMMQPQYRDKQQVVKDLKRLHREGKLTPYQAEHWFGKRPKEELYDMANDPHQIRNLAEDPNYTVVLKEHRKVLQEWISTTDDQGQYPESADSLRGTWELWKERPRFKNAEVNPEYDIFRDESSNQ